MVEEDGTAADVAAAAVDPDEVIGFAQALVRAPSENPGGTESEAVAVAADVLTGLGARVTIVESDGGRPNLVAATGDANGRTLVWNGHLDVVPAGDPLEWPHPPFAATIDAGRLIGRGSADMKGPVASALAAVAAIRRAGLEPAGTLALHLVADEEHMGVHGTRVLVERDLLRADACIVGEPSGMDLVLAQRGGGWITAVAHGRAAHGSQPHRGVNAIASMARFLLALPEVLPDRSHPLVGSPTVNAAMISGGRAPNVVPDRCEVAIDRRVIPGETPEEVIGPFHELIARLRAEHPELEIEVGFHQWSDPAETPPDSEIAGVLRRAIATERGEPPSDIGFTGITDARFYINEARIPTVVCGPGDLAVAHTTGEHVEIADLVTAARAYARAFVDYLGT